MKQIVFFIVLLSGLYSSYAQDKSYNVKYFRNAIDPEKSHYASRDTAKLMFESDPYSKIFLFFDLSPDVKELRLFLKKVKASSNYSNRKIVFYYNDGFTANDTLDNVSYNEDQNSWIARFLSNGDNFNNRKLLNNLRKISLRQIRFYAIGDDYETLKIKEETAEKIRRTAERMGVLMNDPK